MKNIIYVTFLAYFLIACDIVERKNAKIERNYPASESPLVTNFQFIPLDSSEYIIIEPFTSTENRKTYDMNSSGKEGKVGYWNLIFYNPNTKKQHLLIKDKPVRILQVLTSLGNDTQNPFIYKYIFYIIIAEDFNKDGKLDYNDPAYLFASDREGKNLKQISPSGKTFVSWQNPQNKQWLFITLKEDTNQDKVFANNEKNIIYQIDLSKDILKIESIFSKEFQKEIKTTYDKFYPEKEE